MTFALLTSLSAKSVLILMDAGKDVNSKIQNHEIIFCYILLYFVSRSNRARLLVKADCACRNVELCVFKDKIRALYKGRFYGIELVEEPKGRGHAPLVLKETIAKTLKADGKAGSD